MKIKNSYLSLLSRSLAESLTFDFMRKLMREILPEYNIFQRTGYPENMPVPKHDAALQIVRDLRSYNLIPQLITLLVEVHTKGFMGRVHKINHIKEIIYELNNMGYIYDSETSMFLEDQSKRKTRNWGVLVQDVEYIFTFLRIDIAGNSQLVKKYPQDVIQKTYEDLHNLFTEAVHKHNGRVWSWEGDGGLAAFYFGNKNHSAALSGMSIVHELFLYNELACRLNSPLPIRVAIHSGPCEYTANNEEILKNETIKKTIEVEEKFTEIHTLTFSDVVARNLDELLFNQFEKINIGRQHACYNYKIQWKTHEHNSIF